MSTRRIIVGRFGQSFCNGVLALSESRASIGNPYLFCLDLAMLYRIQGNQDKMVQEYLNYVTQNSAKYQCYKVELPKQEEDTQIGPANLYWKLKSGVL